VAVVSRVRSVTSGAELHARGQFVRGDTGTELRVLGVPGQVFVIEEFEQVSRRAVSCLGNPPRAGQVGYRLIGVEYRPLKDSRQEAVIPVGRPLLRHASRIGNGNVGGRFWLSVPSA